MNKTVLTRFHYLIEFLSYVLILASFVIGIVTIAKGEDIPLQFDFYGNVTEYGSPGVLIVLPIIMLISVGTMSLMLHFMPFSSWNMPFKVRPGKEREVFGCIGYMIAIMEFLFGILSLAYTLFSMVGKGDAMGTFTIIFMVALFADIIVCCIIAGIKNKR